MLKLQTIKLIEVIGRAAAFGRLCVETDTQNKEHRVGDAAAFGRLCVETAFLIAMDIVS